MELTRAERRALDELMKQTNANGGVPPSVQAIADALAVNRSVVSRQLKSARAKGHIQQVAGRYAIEVAEVAG